MKQRKRSGLFRIAAFLLVMLLAVNLVVPCFAATDSDYPYLYWDDTKTFETGVLNYDYDQIPEYMLDSMILRALEFTGYDVQFLKEQQLLFHPDYVGAPLIANQFLLRDDPILTEIHYSDSGKPGGSVKTAETEWEKAWTLTGKVPNIPTHVENGMSCTSFVEYFYFAYLPNCEGKDVSDVISMYNIALDRVVNKTGTYPDTWTEMFEGEGGLISQGLAKHFEIELTNSQDQTEEYNAIWRDLHPGAVIRFGNESSPYIHYAIYAGTYNNLHYVIHVGNNRGPEIIIAEAMAAETSSKQSWPIDFYDLKLEQKYGSIQVVKADADDDTKLAGAFFVATNQITGESYSIGPTNEYGYALREDLPLGTYDVVEVVPPMGYALDPTVHEVILSEEDSFHTLYQEITNKKSYGSLQIIKNTNTGNNKAGWQFNLYKNSPTHTAQLTTDNSGQMFRVTVSDSSGNSVTSTAVSMEITPLKILIHPGDATVELGERALWTVTAQGEGLTYEWQYKNPGDSDWSVSSYNGTACWYKPTTMDKNGRLVRCVVTDMYGNSVTSEIAELIIGTSTASVAETSEAAAVQSEAASSTDVEAVAEEELAIITQPQSYVGSEGSYTTFTVEAQGDGLTYVWETSTDGGSTWTTLTTPINETPYVTDGNGEYLISSIQTGDYFVQEIDTGMDGWEYDLVAKPVMVTADHTTTAPATVNFTNNELTGGLLIVKTTEDKKNLAGWQFGIYTDASCDEEYQVGDIITTRAGGRMSVTDLLPGTYWVKELGHIDPAIDELYDCASENPQMVTVTAGSTTPVLFTNILKRGTIEIVKKGDNGELLSGAAFQATDASGKVYTFVESAVTGYYHLSNVPYGTYTIVELTPPEGYKISDQGEWTVTLNSEKESITIINIQIRGRGKIVKTTVNGGSAAGWQFKVWQDGTDPITVTTDENGEFDMGLLAPGTYYVKEVGHETYDTRYWIMDSEVKTLTVVAGETTSVSFENTWMGELVIDKEAVNSDLLAGWTGELYLVNADNTETKIGTYTSDADGRFVDLLVALGKYIFRETGHVDSSVDLTYWVMAGDQEFTVTAGSTASATIINTELGYGEIVKDTTNGGTKEGWIFQIKDAAGNVLDGEYISNADGYIGLGLLAPSTYYVQEIGHSSMTAEQLAYWVMDSEAKTLTVVAGETASVSFENQWRGYGQIKKEMPDGGSVAGWIFDVYRVSDNTYIGEFTSDTDGNAVIGYLIPGDYRVVERVPEGSLYLPVGGNEKILTVVAGEVSTLTVRNVLQSGEIVLNKLDSSNDKVLAGAKFLLEWLDGDVWKPVVLSDTVIPGGCRSEGLVNGCLVTDANGQAIFEGLHPDLEYRLTEVEPPDGYMLQAISVFEGKLPADTLSKEVTAYNSGIFDVPETGVNDHLTELMVFAAVIVCLFFIVVAMAAKEGLLTEMIRK